MHVHDDALRASIARRFYNDTVRDALIVRDHTALKAISCPCNELVKIHFEEVLAGVYPNGND